MLHEANPVYTHAGVIHVIIPTALDCSQFNFEIKTHIPNAFALALVLVANKYCPKAYYWCFKALFTQLYGAYWRFPTQGDIQEIYW